MHDTDTKIEEIRAEIEAIDRKIVPLIARRIHLNGALGPLKLAAGVENHLPQRIALVVERWMKLAVDQGINPELVGSLCKQIIAEGEKLQAEQMNLSAGG